jgi:hypothetical protein
VTRFDLLKEICCPGKRRVTVTDKRPLHFKDFGADTPSVHYDEHKVLGKIAVAEKIRDHFHKRMMDEQLQFFFAAGQGGLQSSIQIFHNFILP